MITVYCGLFFMSDQPEIYQSSNYLVQEHDNGLRLSEGMKIMMFLLIVGSNSLFFGYWVYKMYVEVRIVMLNKMEKVYMIMCLCGDKGKLKRAQQ
jgi:hypothetical protein